MYKKPTSKRMAGALIMTAFLAALFLLIAAYGPGSAAQSASAHKIAQAAPAHETEQETRTEQPHETQTEEPHETQTPEATRTHEVEPTETHEPEVTETEQPHESRTPETTRTEQPHETETHEPEVTETEQPHETRTPEATRTEEPHETETEQPHESRTPEATRTHEVEPTETHEPEVTETEQPHETRTPEATETAEPSETAGISKPPATSGSVALPGTGSRTFAETGKTVRGIFLQYWDNNGGLLQQGLPISNMMQEQSALDGRTYGVQYFERAVFEYHPELSVPNNILLSQLGTFRYKAMYPNGAPGQVANKNGGTFFPQTGHYVGGTFLKYWQQHGGLAQQGYPISDEFTEVSPLDGKTYRVQYFERAVFETHPENKAPYDVLLSQLGTFQYKAKYSSK